MKIKVKRTNCGLKSTLSDVYVDNEWFCFGLEDQDRELESGGEKVKAHTCIPRGEYELVITFSNRFKRELPLLKDVPQFEGIRIHPGNTHDDTEGCILVGSSWFDTNSGPALNNSRATFDKLFELLEAAYDSGEPITVEVI